MKLPKAWQSWRSIPQDDPKRLARLVAAGIKLRDKRKALEQEAEVLQKEETALKAFLIDNFTNDDLKEIKTSAGSARLVFKTLPQMDESTGGWPKIWEYIFKNKASDLLQKRLNEGACKQRWDDGKDIPGVKKFTLKTIKLGDAE